MSGGYLHGPILPQQRYGVKGLIYNFLAINALSCCGKPLHLLRNYLEMPDASQFACVLVDDRDNYDVVFLLVIRRPNDDGIVA